MLIQFNFKNFKSFRDEVSLDLTATKITEHPSHVLNINNEKLLSIAAIYGANASGKSNIFEAFEYMSYYVQESFKFGGDNDLKQKITHQYQKTKPFLFDDESLNSPSTFEVFFISNEDSGRVYQYGFSVNRDEVLEEWLFSKAKTAKEYKTIFYRKKDEPVDYAGIKRGSDNIDVSLEKETLIVSLGAKLKIEKLRMVWDWFIKNETVDFGNPYENLFRSSTVPTRFVDDAKIQFNVIKYINTFDETIHNFKVRKEIAQNENSEAPNIHIETLHMNPKTGEFVELPLSEESSGTLKMFSLYEPIRNVLENGSVLFVDELNSRLHPLLVRNIITTFANPEINKKNAQIIFTTHDIWQLTNELLRRDEVWFVEKDENGLSSLYSLSDFKDEDGQKIRKDEAYANNYMLGRYGAIATLKSLNVFGEDS